MKKTKPILKETEERIRGLIALNADNEKKIKELELKNNSLAIEVKFLRDREEFLAIKLEILAKEYSETIDCLITHKTRWQIKYMSQCNSLENFTNQE